MTKYHKRHRIIATFFLLIFFPTLLPNNLFASNNGPKSPEAASFEPVDATDMVNLITGQYSYVLPLLNVPSPEGGYPLAMAYHGGIAMDQQSSWAGLGWNINPGSIDRNINGYPDDYDQDIINEYFYDSSRTQYISSISIGYSNGGASVGLGFNWGSNQSLGGVVSVGYGYQDASGAGVGGSASVGFGSSAGKNSVGIGVTAAGGLTLGVSANSDGTVGISAGAVNNNSEGFSIGYDTAGNISADLNSTKGKNLGTIASIGITISSKGEISSRVSTIGGTGQSYAFQNTISMGDYSNSASAWMVPLSVPTPVGVFSLSFGKQELTYYLSKNKNIFMGGVLHFHKLSGYYIVSIKNPSIPNYPGNNTIKYFENLNNAQLYKDQMSAKYPQLLVTVGNYLNAADYPYLNTVNTGDVHEFSMEEQLDIQKNNLILPNYDNFNVSAQGISGSFKANIYGNNVLDGVSIGDNSLGYRVLYAKPIDNEIGFAKSDFYFDNEISTYLNTTDVNPVVLNSNSFPPNSIAGYYSHGDHITRTKRRTAKGIRYWENGEIAKDNNLKYSGFLDTNASGFNRANSPAQGIGAFEITANDGKTYHYSLPVYNHEIITRKYGMIEGHTQESEAYMEKRQLKPFATHWLLTAVTGPDFVDNGDGIAGDGDLGYYTTFDYGLWSDAYVWNQGNGKDIFTDQANPNIKTWIKGRKQIYYLDKIKTRTHTAIFVKDLKNDSQSKQMNYSSVTHEDDRQLSSSDYLNRFTIPSHSLLKLKKILLFKNQDLTSDKTSGTNTNSSVDINYSKNYIFTNPTGNPGDHAIQDLNHTKKEIATYNNYDNVYDTNDNWSLNISKAIKVIDFSYDNSLYKGEGCLTLKSVNFKGKSDTNVLPPYKFDYENGTNISFNDLENYTDGWGYNTLSPKQWSLKQITTPSGGKININYEPNTFKSAMPHTLIFKNSNTIQYTATTPAYTSSFTDLSNKKITISVGNNNNFPLVINQIVNIDYMHKLIDTGSPSKARQLSYKGTGRISQILSGVGNYEVTFDAPITHLLVSTFPIHYSTQRDIEKKIDVNIIMNSSNIYTGGGLRVKSLIVSDAVNSYTTEYNYGKNGDGIGFVSYIPYAQNAYKEMPYSAELPSPRAMYEYVSVNSKDRNNISNGRIQYKFNVLKDKDPNNIKFGEFFEITEQKNDYINQNASSVSLNHFNVKDNLNAIGQLLEVIKFNSKDQILSKLTNKYYSTTQIPNNNGVLKESYHSYKIIDPAQDGLLNKWIINTSSKIKYPSIISSSTEQNNGYSYTTQFLDYDELSGISKEQIMFSSDGTMIKSKIVPAFRKYPGMDVNYLYNGEPKPKNLNMLSQIAAYYNYIYQSGTWKETSVGITTWSNLWKYTDTQGNTEPYRTSPNVYTDPNYSREDLYKYRKQFIWRKHKSYVWNGSKDSNGIFVNFNSTNDDNFNWPSKTYGPGGGILQDPINWATTDEQPVQWKQVSEITKYNHYSKPLEVKDINNNFISTKMGDKDSKVIATGNARYSEMFFSGAENEPTINFPTYLEPEITMTNAYRNSVYYHTGKQSVAATSSSQFGVNMKNNQHKAGKYKVSVWIEKTNSTKARLNNNGIITDFTETYTAGNWVLKSGYVDVPTGSCSISVTSIDSSIVYFDDLIIRPVSSSITGYVYNEWDELTYIIGNNGLATKFEYDASGRLVKTSIEVIDDSANGVIGGFKVVKTNAYNNKYFN